MLFVVDSDVNDAESRLLDTDAVLKLSFSEKTSPSRESSQKSPSRVETSQNITEMMLFIYYKFTPTKIICANLQFNE